MDFEIIEGAENMRVEDAVRLLKPTYWAGKRSPETIERSMRNSMCYGVRVPGEKRLVGFARVITDLATTWYLCDVIIDPAYRGRGLGRALVGHIASRPEFKGLRGFLITRDAHGLYSHFGVETVDGRVMMKVPAMPGGTETHDER